MKLSITERGAIMEVSPDGPEENPSLGGTEPDEESLAVARAAAKLIQSEGGIIACIHGRRIETLDGTLRRAEVMYGWPGIPADAIYVMAGELPYPPNAAEEIFALAMTKRAAA